MTFCGLTRLFNSFVVNVAVKCTFEIACRLSVCLSVTLRYRDHIGWNTSKIILWPNSLRHARADPNMGDLVQREHPKIRVE